ncbi:uncharacterized protein STEHIDRAFT_160579 [Stereum hirsutum FP-91666 SS1]|uniref:uncharacterized protein n=1 Tax=Stereum hirsutum (strain FP-91666) TaxID=721885 RepID=UPI0004449463|nr:uncharacterized protein STEHIDRAFT_160579 [Stereum hirsutum FP-91666 SS1]EIM82967.1 hypothetical protein STEHIDRAFT_160579 [Stereum hirsutum FP-91666 SS1]
MSASQAAFNEVVLEDRLWQVLTFDLLVYSTSLSPITLRIIDDYAVLSSSILWMFDFIQTLPMEIEGVWSSRPTGTAAIFLVNRYCFGMSLILQLVIGSPVSATDKSCNALAISEAILQITATISTNLLFTLRVYAICGQSRAVLCMALTMILARFGVNLWQNAPTDIVTAVLPLAFDAYVFGITVFKTYGHVTQMRKQGQRSITEVLLRDGILYFFIVSVASAANLALQLAALADKDTEASLLWSEVLSNYLIVLPNLLANRLYLNLRVLADPGSTMTSGHKDMPEPAFAHNRFLGNIGAPLDPNWWETRFEDDYADHSTTSRLSGQDGPMVSPEGNGQTTLIPVVYDGNQRDIADIEMVPMQRECS